MKFIFIAATVSVFWADLTAAQDEPKGLLSLPSTTQEQVQPILEQLLFAIEEGNTDRIQSTVAQGRGLDGWAPFQDCGTHCQHHLDDGDAVKYGVCYAACVIRGGPGLSGGTIGEESVAPLDGQVVAPSDPVVSSNIVVTFTCGSDTSECEARADVLEAEASGEWSCTSIPGGVECEAPD